MAGRPRRKRRVRTAAQRAALKKAQAASARKRRRRRVKNNVRAAGRFVGGVAGAAAVYHINSVARNPQKAVKGYKKTKAYIGQRKAKKLTPAIPTAPKQYKYHGGHRGYLL